MRLLNFVKIFATTEIINMENQILEAISHIRKISKKKTIDRILAQINNSAATNWDLESGKLCLNEMTAKGIITLETNLNS